MGFSYKNACFLTFSKNRGCRKAGKKLEVAVLSKIVLRTNRFQQFNELKS
jgi:hypothetical protein